MDAVPVISDTTVRALTEDTPIEDAEWVFIELPVAGREPVGTDGESLRIGVRGKCEDRCSDTCGTPPRM